MICWSTIETVCPMRGYQLYVREVGGCDLLGQDTDLLIRTRAPHVIRLEVYSCPDCRFSGYSSDFLEGRIAELTIETYFREYIEKLEDDYEAAGPAADPPTHLQYFWSGLLSPLLGHPARETGLRMLRAYWSLRLDPVPDLGDSGLKNLEQRYLRQAIAYLRKSLHQEKNFNRFLARSTRPRHLRNAASRLIKRARRRDCRHMSMERLLYPTRDQSKTIDGREEEKGA